MRPGRLLAASVLALCCEHAISFTAGQAMFTMMVLIVFNLMQPQGWQVGIIRVEDIVIGAAGEGGTVTTTRHITLQVVDDSDAAMARPLGVSVSYIEADRWLAAEEKVDNLPLPSELCEWLRVFTNDHFKPDGPRRQRAQSFLSPEERDRQARALREGGHG